MIFSAFGRRVSNEVAPQDQRTAARPATHMLWYCDGLLLFFLVSAGCTRVLKIDNDFYYAVLSWVALTFLFYYVKITNSHVLQWCRQRWRSSLAFGGLTAIYVVVAVWQATPTGRPTGLLLIFEVAWRGIGYAVASSLALTVFPFCVAVGLVVRDDVVGFASRLVLAVATTGLIWVMSTVYHAGFSQYDGDVVTPQLQTAVVSIPAIVTANPVGSVLAQTSLHVTATLRTFESDVFVPPSVEHTPLFEPPGVFRPPE